MLPFFNSVAVENIQIYEKGTDNHTNFLGHPKYKILFIYIKEINSNPHLPFLGMCSDDRRGFLGRPIIPELDFIGKTRI